MKSRLSTAAFATLLLGCLHAPSSFALVTLPVDGILQFEVLEGHGASSTQEFGFGTPATSTVPHERQILFTISLVNEAVFNVLPAFVVNAGFFAGGTNLDFYNLSNFGGSPSWAYSSHLTGSPTFADLEVFTDRNNSLGFGGSAVEQINANTWVLRLDDAASTDGDNNEMVDLALVRHSP